MNGMLTLRYVYLFNIGMMGVILKLAFFSNILLLLNICGNPWENPNFTITYKLKSKTL